MPLLIPPPRLLLRGTPAAPRGAPRWAPAAGAPALSHAAAGGAVSPARLPCRLLTSGGRGGRGSDRARCASTTPPPPVPPPPSPMVLLLRVGAAPYAPVPADGLLALDRDGLLRCARESLGHGAALADVELRRCRVVVCAAAAAGGPPTPEEEAAAVT